MALEDWIRVERHADGMRVWVRRRRTHHAVGGFALITLGLIIVLSDVHDRRVWWRDLLTSE